VFVTESAAAMQRSGRATGDSDLTVAALLALGTISYQEVYERKEFLVAGGGFEPLTFAPAIGRRPVRTRTVHGQFEQ
jgi:hypothetical protein